MNRRIAQPVAMVVRCAEAGPRMWDTLRSIERQSRRPREVVVVVDPSTAPGSKRWLTAVAAARSYIVVEAADVRPAVVKNAGIRATAAAFISCVAVGDELHPRFLERTVGALTRRKACAIATTWCERIGPGSRVRADGVEHVTLSGCLSNPDAIDDTAVFRRVDWESRGGFDEGLEALEGLDLWLGVLEGDAGVAVVTEQLVSRRAESQLSRRALEPDTRVRAMARILSRHRASFDAHVADVLADRRTRLHRTSTAYQRARARRETAKAELQTLLACCRELETQVLRRSGSPGAGLADAGSRTECDGEPLEPVDRRAVDGFLDACRTDVKGVVLDAQEAYSGRRLQVEHVNRLDIVDVDGANPRATIVSDLRCATNVPSSSYDSIVLWQTVHFADDLSAVVAEGWRLLKPGGVLVAVLTCAELASGGYLRAHQGPRLTNFEARRAFDQHFGPLAVVTSHGNAISAAAFTYGLDARHVPPAAFDFTDTSAPVVITARAQKQQA